MGSLLQNKQSLTITQIKNHLFERAHDHELSYTIEDYQVIGLT